MNNLKKTTVLLAVVTMLSGCINSDRYVKESQDTTTNQVSTNKQESDKKIKSEAKDEMVNNYVSKPAPKMVRNQALKVAPATTGAIAPNEPEYKKQKQDFNTEEYSNIEENIFLTSEKNPLSTFSIDVDTASYSNIRRFINSNQLPPKDAVRIEEMLNYFTYNYPQPTGKDPFSINLDMTQSPWNKENKIVRVGLQGKKIDTKKMPPANIVFLIDTSGSMEDENKLPLLKSAYKLLVNELREQDRVSIVAYAGSAGVVLEPTSGIYKDKIIQAIDNLQAGGSTAGGEGIELAYKLAEQSFKENGNNRVILATDGDFNVGASSEGELIRLIEEKRQKGVFLSVLGFGMGNYKDSKMEQLADKGNGNYAYIDSIKEAKKVFVEQMGSTLLTIAKDVKIQIEFNPNKVQAYRLIGYENRKLNNEDFNDDKKDAGEMGSGHSVTALYEIVPVGINSKYIKSVDKLKYQETNKTIESVNDEILTVKFRYKNPKEDKSNLITKTLKDQEIQLSKVSSDLRFALSVAQFGMILRNSEFRGNSTLNDTLSLASSSVNNNDYRKEFFKLVEKYQGLTKNENKQGYND
ncbi:MAG: VWA domain-containing protein [Candidatus Sericytochromatia bacterium]